MSTVRVEPLRPDAEVIERAAGLIRGGGLVAFPTETVYGLGANALDPAAVARIFSAKGRPSYNPLISHVEDAAAARRLARLWPASADLLAEAFWPGPLTLVVPKSAAVPDIVTAGLDSVALRVPAHPVALALLRATRLPIAAPSANRFTEVSPTTAAHVAKGLGPRVDMILDGGATRVGIESTVLGLTGDVPVLLRPGSIPLDRIEAIVGPLARTADVPGSTPRPSPGMVDRHYSPRAPLMILDAVNRSEVEDEVKRARARGGLVCGMLMRPLPFDVDHPVQMPGSADGYARELYAALHRFDDLGCGLIIADAVPESPEWAAVRDRLKRASGSR